MKTKPMRSPQVAAMVSGAAVGAVWSTSREGMCHDRFGGQPRLSLGACPRFSIGSVPLSVCPLRAAKEGQQEEAAGSGQRAGREARQAGRTRISPPPSHKSRSHQRRNTHNRGYVSSLCVRAVQCCTLGCCCCLLTESEAHRRTHAPAGLHPLSPSTKPSTPQNTSQHAYPQV